MIKKQDPKHLSLLGLVNFYKGLLKKGTIIEGSTAHNRMKQLETKLSVKRRYRVPVCPGIGSTKLH